MMAVRGEVLGEEIQQLVLVVLELRIRDTLAVMHPLEQVLAVVAEEHLRLALHQPVLATLQQAEPDWLIL
jgi:hypothetical protein